MIASWVLTRYIATLFFKGVMSALLGFVVLILMVDLLELFRNAQGVDVSWHVLFSMAMLRVPERIQEVMPFAVLLGSILSFGKLARGSELVVMRSAGISVWQFLMPAIIAALLLGLLMTMIVNPFAALLSQKVERLQNKYLEQKQSSFSVGKTGLWLRQTNNYYHYEGDSQPITEGETIIHAADVLGSVDVTLSDVTFFVFGKNYKYIKRIDAKQARLLKDEDAAERDMGFWELRDSVITSPGDISSSQVHNTYFIQTYLTTQDIHNSLASPKTIPFWSLPVFIDTLSRSGFPARAHVLQYHTLLANPFMYMGMVFIAVMFCLRASRQSKTAVMLASGIFAGFVVYFLTHLVSSLGLSGNIPVALAAWAPVAASVLAGVGVMLHIEDG